MSKRFLSLLMALVICFSMLPTAALAETSDAAAEKTQNGENATDVYNVVEETVVQSGESGDALKQADTHSNHKVGDKDAAFVAWTDDLAAEQDELNKGYTASDSLPAKPGCYYLTGPVDLSEIYIPPGSDESFDGVVLCLNGYDITSSGNTVIAIDEGRTFTLCDCKGTGKITRPQDNSGNYTGGGVAVNGTFNMYGGIITGHKLYNNAGVSVEGGNAVFNMYGGAVSGNAAENNGGGVYVHTGAVFNMYNGTITGNTAGNNGGGVYLLGTFTMENGTISGNTAVRSGGGVHIGGGTFTMSAGTIGSSTGSTIRNEAANGGGVYVDGGTFNMIGTNSTTPQVFGNYADTEGSGVYVHSGQFRIAKGVLITNNSDQSDVYLDDGQTIQIAGNLYGESVIGVSVKNLSAADESYVTFAEGCDGYTLTDSDRNAFYANQYAELGVKYKLRRSGNELRVVNGNLHTHPICGDDNCTESGHKLPDGAKWVGVSELTDNMAEGYYYLTDDIVSGSIWAPNNRVTLCLNGHSITPNSFNSAFELRDNKTVTLCDCDTQCRGIVNSDRPEGVGVYLGGGTLNLYSGKITGGNYGVHIAQDNSTFNMYGGIYAINCTVVLRENAMVTGNQIGSYAGGIYCNCTLNVSGNVQITGNEEVYSHGGIVTSNVAFNYDKSNPIIFSVIGELSNTARIGVIEKSKAFNNGIDFFTFAKAAAPSAETAANWIKTGNFISDQESSYKTEVTENGTEAILRKHNHTWEYTASGATITAECSECSESGGSVTIQVPADKRLTYSGRGKEATLDGRFYTGETQPTISYTSKDGSINYAIPIDAGDYRASITAGGLTVSADYTVKKAKLTVTANANTIAYGDPPADKGVTYKGFANGENESVLNGSLNYTYSYDPGYGDTGLYIITPNGLTARNYEIDFVPGTLTVVPREVTLSWNNTENRTYGDGKLVTAEAGNLVNGDEISVDVTGGDKNETGTHTAAAAGLTGSKAGRYKLPDDNAKRTFTYTVNKGKLENKELTMPVYKGVSKTYTYDFSEKLPELADGLKFGNIQYTGTLSEGYDESWISKDNVKLNGSVLSIFTHDWDRGTQILEYVVTVKSDNYEDFTMTLKVNAADKKEADLSINIIPWSYGSGGINEPVVLNEPADAKWVSTVYKNKATGKEIIPNGKTDDAGEYTVTVRYESDDTVYIGTKDFVINPRHLSKETVEVPAGVTADKIYDGTTASDLTELGIEKGMQVTEEDGALRIVGTSEYADSNAGETRLVFTTDGTIRLSDPSSSAKPSNYSTNPTKLTALFKANILQRELSFTATGVSKIYGSNDATAEVAVSFRPVSGKDKTGLVDGETLVQGVDYDVRAIFSETEVGEDSNVRVTVTLKDTQKARNYKLNSSEITATGTIKPKPIPVLDGDLTLSAAEITYGEKLSKIGISGTMKDSVTDAKVNGTFAWQNPDEVPNAGTCNASWTFTPAAGYEKYAAAAGTVTVKVNKADILEGVDYTVPAAAAKLEYNGNEQELITAGTATVGTMQYKLGESGDWSEKIPTATKAGSYDVYYRVFGGSNYNTTKEQKITCSIAKRSVTISNKPEREGYKTTYMYGDLIQKPKISNFDITGSEDNAEFSYVWIGEEPKLYSKLGDYKVKVIVGETANTAGGYLEIPVEIVRNTSLVGFMSGFDYMVYNNTGTVSYEIDYVHEIDPNEMAIDTETLKVKPNDFIILVKDANDQYIPYDKDTCDFEMTVTEGAAKGTLRVALTGLNKGITRLPFCMITVQAEDEHYANIEVQVRLQVKEKAQKTLGVKMDSFTYGDTASTPAYNAPEGTPASVTYAAKDGTNLTEAPTEAGDYTVTVVCETKDTIYSGSADYTISPKPISDVDSYLDKDIFTYNGGEQKPVVTADMNGNALMENKDYTVIYPTNMTDVGTKDIKIKGIGNFSGEKTVSYQIEKATVKVNPKNISKVYGDEPKFKLESDSPLITADELDKAADSATFTSDGAAKTAPVTANGYTISVQLSGRDEPDNITLEVGGTGILTVEKADLTITVKDVSREYGAPNPELEVIYSGFVNGEDERVLNGELILKYDKSKINEQSAVDHYLKATTAEGLTSDNYNINYVEGDVDITKIKVNASDGKARKSYLSVVFDKSLEGLSAKNFIIKDSEGNTVTATNIIASSDGKTYTLSGSFEVGKEYTVKVVLSDAAVDATHQLTTDEFAITPISTSSGGGGSASVTYTVSFDTNGGSELSKQTVARNSAIKEPTAPTKEGFDFAGWYADKELKTKYDFSAKVTKNITLYAAWTEKDNSVNQIILTIGEKSAQVFGQTKTNDVAPKIVNDRTMLPARFVAENLGADVLWDGEKGLVTIKGKKLKTSEDITILIYIGSDIAYVNGKEIKLDSAAFVENDRTYTPVRFISEELGASVEWIESEQKVVITK